MTDSTEGMTPQQRAEAYEAEAAHVLDKVTKRGYWTGEVSPEAAKFVDLIVQAAVERMKAEPAPARCPETWQPAVGGDVGRCTLAVGHAGKHLMDSRSGVPWVHPGNIDSELNPAPAPKCTAAFNCILPPGHDGLHKFDCE